MDSIKKICIQKVAVLRDFIHLKHSEKSLDHSWNSDQIPPDIRDSIKQKKSNKNKDAEAEVRRKKQLEKEKQEETDTLSAQSMNIFDILRQTNPVSSKRKKSSLMEVDDDEDDDDEITHIDPCKITMEMTSKTVATLSVNWYL